MSLPRLCLRTAARGAGRLIAGLPSPTLRRELVATIYDADVESVVDALMPRIHERMTLADVLIDPSHAGPIEFEDLMGLYPTTPLTMGVTLMSPRQLAHLFRVARRSGARRAIEIGRYRGGGTLTLAAAMGAAGTVWSVDDGSAAPAGRGIGDHDALLRALATRLGLDVRLVAGDSRVARADTGEVDLVVIDADHSAEAVRADFERWGRRVRMGGHVLLDDAFPSGGYARHSHDVGAVVGEATRTGFDLRDRVDRMADLVRTR